MNSQEKLSAERIARLMRAARKRAGLGQVEVAQKLGISQGAVSRTEHGILVPSAPIWFDFCKLTGISPDCLVTGFIEKNTPAFLESQENTGGFKLNPRYTSQRGSKIRAMIPFLHYCENVYGSKGMTDLLKSLKVDPDFVVDLDNQINLNFCIDISAQLVRDGHLKPKNLAKLAKSVTQSQTHGSLQRFYDAASGAINRLQVLLMNSRYYECNFDYKIEDYSNSSIELSITPNKHLSDFTYRDNDDLGDFFCRYKQLYFERFAFADAAGGKLVEKECHYHGGDKCVYQLKAS